MKKQPLLRRLLCWLGFHAPIDECTPVGFADWRCPYCRRLR